MKYSILILFCIICLISAGCFVRIPTTSNEEMNQNVGKFGVLNRDVILVNFFMSKVAWDLEKENNLGPKQHVIRKMKKGTKIKIKSVGYRRLPHGLFYVYVCEDIESKDVFEINRDKFDAIKLESKS